MEETIISINGANIVSIAIMVIVIFSIAYFLMMSVGKMKGASND
jgi:hypothetical protein